MKNFLLQIFVFSITCCLFTTNSFSKTPGSFDTYTFATTEDVKRFQTLSNEIRCVVCQNQTIADSNAPIAQDLREKIYRMILDQQSDQAIKNFLVKRYGAFILLKPPLDKSTIYLWLFPFLGFSLGIWLINRYARS